MSPENSGDSSIRAGEPPIPSPSLSTSESPNSRFAGFLAFWPVWAALVLLAVCAFFVFVVPGWEKSLSEQKVELPWIADLLIACSRWFVKYWYVALLMIFGGMWFASALAWVLQPQARRRSWCFAIASALVAVVAVGLLALWMCWLFGPVAFAGWRFR